MVSYYPFYVSSVTVRNALVFWWLYLVFLMTVPCLCWTTLRVFTGPVIRDDAQPPQQRRKWRPVLGIPINSRGLFLRLLVFILCSQLLRHLTTTRASKKKFNRIHWSSVKTLCTYKGKTWYLFVKSWVGSLPFWLLLLSTNLFAIKNSTLKSYHWWNWFRIALINERQ